MPTINQKADAAIDRKRSTVYSWLLTCPPSDYNFTHNLNQADAATIQAVLNDLPEKDNKSRITILERRLRKLQKTAPKNETKSVQNETIPATNEPVSPDAVVAIETALIDPSPFEPQARRRSHYDQSSLAELADSIKQFGLWSPIIVRFISETQRYEIVFGERRWTATKQAGLDKINCFVKTLTDEETLSMQALENLQREQLDPLDEAFYYKYLLEHSPMTPHDLAIKFGKTEKFIRQRLKLNNLIAEAIDEIEEGSLPLGHALEMAKYPAESQKIIVEEQLAYEWNDKENGAATLAEFKEEIAEHVVRLLKNAPFDTEDPRLRLDNLICPNCPRRSKFEPLLFADEFDDDDRCLDGKCFQFKTDVHLRLQREEIALKMPNPQNKPVDEMVKKVPLVTDKVWADKDETPFNEKILTKQTFYEQPECEYSVLSLIADGARKGEQTYICTNGHCKVHSEKEKKESAAKPSAYELKKKEDDFNLKVGLAVRQKIFAGAIEFFGDNNPFWQYADLVESLIAQTLFSKHHYLKNSFPDIFLEFPNCPRNFDDSTKNLEFVRSCDRRRQTQLLFLCTHAETGYMTWRPEPQDEVKKIATGYTKLDYALIDAETRLELAPDEFKPVAQWHLEKVKRGEPSAIPFFWMSAEETEE